MSQLRILPMVLCLMLAFPVMALALAQPGTPRHLRTLRCPAGLITRSFINER